MIPGRLEPLLAQYDFGCRRLLDRLTGPGVNSGNGVLVAVPPLTDEEYFWEPVDGCWSIRRESDGPAKGATGLVGAGEWKRDTALPAHPEPPPFTTIAWRLAHVTEMLVGRADHTVGPHTLTRDDITYAGTAADAVEALRAGVQAWRAALTTADDAALEEIGRSAYPYGSDPEEPFLAIVWWMNQEILHHAAEIALLRDLYRERTRQR
jgi:DinB superfamily